MQVRVHWPFSPLLLQRAPVFVVPLFDRHASQVNSTQIRSAEEFSWTCAVVFHRTGTLLSHLFHSQRQSLHFRAYSFNAVTTRFGALMKLHQNAYFVSAWDGASHQYCRCRNYLCRFYRDRLQNVFWSVLQRPATV